MLDLLYKRRSIRKYKPTKIDRDTVQVLLKAALLSPSSCGLRPWQFVVVDDSETLSRLAAAKKGAGHLKGAALAIVVLADPNLSDVWVEDASIAATILHLTAESLGLGSCWIQIRKRQYSDTETAEDYVRKILAVPETLTVASIMSFGYPAESKSPYSEEDIKSFSKVYGNRYGSAY
ncbi:nitroreductase family protein [Desulfosporosinus sp. PR]|uniref:nitroreductase family protein n=1 Tax=Candidatus Desulfosporosinus nitrosoreducens TaxID=3401928 RepID=UPI0027F7B58C|nr:nitroreductase family protein [Desulfosporosinus sp. PR]MDQ7096438.1 nitroreductase family protein [Desulfosporosinus sp. PR]